jgi:hypothetical protein
MTHADVGWAVTPKWMISRQDVAENSSDAAHFDFIHKTGPAKPGRAPTTDGPVYEALLVSDEARGGSVW